MPTAAAFAGDAASTRSRIDRVRTEPSEDASIRPSAATFATAWPAGHSIATRVGRATVVPRTDCIRIRSGSNGDRELTRIHVPRLSGPGPSRLGYGAIQAVAGSPSNADDARLPGLPWKRPELSATSGPLVPTRRS